MRRNAPSQSASTPRPDHALRIPVRATPVRLMQRSMSVWGIAHDVSVVAGHAIQGVRAGESKLAFHKLAEGLAPSIEVHSIAFNDDAELPISCTADGVGAPPPLSWHGTPEAAKSVVVICEDPDAPALEPFLALAGVRHPRRCSGIGRAVATRLSARPETGRDQAGFAPAAPPAGRTVYISYHFQVFALNTGGSSWPQASNADELHRYDEGPRAGLGRASRNVSA